MPRKLSFQSIMGAIAREEARRIRGQQRERAHALRGQAHVQKQRERAIALQTKEEKVRYLEFRLQEVEDMNAQLRERWLELSTILDHTLKVDDTIAFDSLRISTPFTPFPIPQDVLQPLPEPELGTYLARVRPQDWMERLFQANRRYDQDIQAAKAAYVKAADTHIQKESARVAKLLALQAQNKLDREAHEAKVVQRAAEVASLEESYRDRDVDAVTTYNSMVLERSEYPDGFPQVFRLAYNPESQELVIELQLPAGSIIPDQIEFRYIKARDAIEAKPRKQSEIRELYQDIVASLAIRTIHEVLEADQGNVLQVITFSGYVETVDPATGKDIAPFLISVRTTKDEFAGINLARIDKKACLQNMGARVSPHALEQQPVKPVVEFNMVDRRFIEQTDVLGQLDSRPNLMELTPAEFEAVTSNLFSRMGLEAKLTRTSRDGGVDVVAFDLRPIVGGKVVIQSKRYRHTVGVSAVRDLYGTMQHEGANKGILVTTSSYGPDAYEFSKDKPIELIDGGSLLFLLNEAGIDARIIMPTIEP